MSPEMNIAVGVRKGRVPNLNRTRHIAGYAAIVLDLTEDASNDGTVGSNLKEFQPAPARITQVSVVTIGEGDKEFVSH